MDIIVGVTVILILIIFIWMFCKNVTVNINIKIPEYDPGVIDIEDLFNESGEFIKQPDGPDWNEVVKEFNSIMLDEEENNG